LVASLAIDQDKQDYEEFILGITLRHYLFVMSLQDKYCLLFGKGSASSFIHEATRLESREDTMNVSAASASVPASIPAPQTAAAAPARAADGDYKKANMQTSQSKDSDGDYKASAAVGSPAATSSANVQAALTLLTKGG
jgi:hypothetical protein